MNNDTIEELFLRYRHPLRQFCLYLTKNNFADAEDLVQESFTRFIARQRKEVLEPVPADKMESYLKAIAHNALREQFRNKINANNSESIDNSQDTNHLEKSSLDSLTEFDWLCRGSFKKLNELERKVILLYYVDDYSLKEIGTICSVSVSYIKRIKSRAIRKLQQVFHLEKNSR